MQNILIWLFVFVTFVLSTELRFKKYYYEGEAIVGTVLFRNNTLTSQKLRILNRLHNNLQFNVYRKNSVVFSHKLSLKHEDGIMPLQIFHIAPNDSVAITINFSSYYPDLQLTPGKYKMRYTIKLTEIDTTEHETNLVIEKNNTDSLIQIYEDLSSQLFVSLPETRQYNTELLYKLCDVNRRNSLQCKYVKKLLFSDPYCENCTYLFSFLNDVCVDKPDVLVNEFLENTHVKRETIVGLLKRGLIKCSDDLIDSLEK